ncbi:MAG: amino acid adenylation domain-containing protein [Acidobacteria bacterium]|nr:amino acid adenylation domain-containing protein [Acidobacteriota bacterium]MBI3655710.1 amino acid adenylation domain-containing protein [Acidobacteriota bacterium]
MTAEVERTACDESAGCLHELFEAWVDLRPDAPAILSDGLCLSYKELEDRANRLARCIRTYGVGPGDLVAIYFERSAAPIVAILACLKAEVAYVPIDPIYPADRIRHILLEAEVSLVLTEQALAARAQSFSSSRLLVTDAPGDEISGQSAARLSRQDSGLTPQDLCYVIYTSGTTGRPKGVMTEHRNAWKFVLAFNEVCSTTQEDRIYQGFSLSFDGSVEEIWMAFSNGAPLVVGTPQTPRFGNDMARFLSRHGVTYFSTVPTMLSTMTEDIPSLRQLVVSGEVCPPELVARWARPGRRVLNAYGPTEATVNTTVAECMPGRPITIGRPLPGYDVYILDDDMQPLPPGEKGELFVGGDTLARGYLKQPDLTAERFVTSSYVGNGEPTRLYRTGDSALINVQGDIEFFGRLDGQVKIRGYRVELAEIETVLIECPGIRAATVSLLEHDGLRELAAFVLVDNAGAPMDRNTVLELLRARLPDYMVPAYLDILHEFPTLASGKVDRKRLPAPVSPLVRTARHIIPPKTDLELKIVAVWQRLFGVTEISIEDDFFLDLGGYSLLAAQMVTMLRSEAGLTVAVRDAYRFPTVKKLAEQIATTETRSPAEPTTADKAKLSSRAAFESLSPWARRACVALQAHSLYLLYGLGTAPLCAFLLLALNVKEGALALKPAVAVGIALGFATWPTLLCVSLAAKWLIIGRYKPGRYPVWGLYYWRWWLVMHMQGMSGAGALTGTPVLRVYYRLMGAKVGRDVALDTAQCFIWDLVTIGDETSIGADTQLLGCRVVDGMLVMGRIDIGSRCFIGIHSALGLNVRMEDDTRLDDQSLLPDGAVMEAGESRRGSPALPAPVAVPEPNPHCALQSRRSALLYGMAHFILIELLGWLLLLPAAPLAVGINFAYVTGGWPWGLLALLASVPAAEVLYCFFIAGLKALALRRPAPGVYPLASVFYLRKWFVDELIKLSRVVLLPLYTTLYLPPWLRLLGARIGARAELSTVWYFSPETMDVGEESFFADGSIIGGKRIFRGQCEIGVNHVGRRSFVGNSAILPVGRGLGDKCLLGVLSAPPCTAEAAVPDGTEWLGSPAFALPHRRKVEGFSDAVTYRPTPKLYFQRAVIDGMRILIPGYIATVVGGAFFAALYFCRLWFGTVGLFALAPVLGIITSIVLCCIVAGLKKLVMGTFQPVIKPLWSPYVWFNEMINGIYESVMAPAMATYLGTPFVVPLLRLIGCKIGRRTFIDSTLFSEFDLVEVGDYAALNHGSVVQTHLFEDRIMKSSYAKIGDECSLGNMAIILYDAEMQQGASLGPLSLLMKGETLGPYTRWHGIPTVSARSSET